MKLRRYTLIDIFGNRAVKSVILTHSEMLILNYAYALNRSCFRYV